MDALADLLRVLDVSRVVYFRPFERHVVPKMGAKQSHELLKFKQSHYATVSTSLAATSFTPRLRDFLRMQGAVVLGVKQTSDDLKEDAMEDEKGYSIQQAESRIANVLVCVDENGLGGAQAQRLFAEIMSELLTMHVNTAYAKKWTSPSVIPERLRVWVDECFSKFVRQVLDCLHGDTDDQNEGVTKVTVQDRASWKQRAIFDLGELRLKELFEITVDWDNNSRGAIEDLKQYIATTSARSHLTHHFSNVLSHRLLQPGASTAEILQIYIRIIRAFAVLEPKGALLDRLARPIRRYLRDRDDTVKIIVSGLLADSEEDMDSTDALVELAVELNKVTETHGEEDDGELDWDDMNWLPDPVDAGPEFKKLKSSDVIGTMISLFESKDVFVKEFQNILGERLLRSGGDFTKEIRVLELLKLRFGGVPLQACEVMLNDIDESRGIDAWIKSEQGSDGPDFALSSKILSTLYWPSLHSETFRLPPEIEQMQEQYSAAFKRHKNHRKVTFLNALGQVSVELQLEDRLVAESVQTWQASVINAFQTSDEGSPVAKSPADLVEELQMDEDLVNNALTFWVGKLVLMKAADGSYSVLEKLPPTSAADTTVEKDNASVTMAAAAAAASASAVASAPAASAVRSDEDLIEEKMAMFWQYIVGMLTNQGAMPLQRIVMMLKFVVPGGFTFGDEALRKFLGRRVDEGKLELAGGNYKIVKGGN